MIYWNNKEDFSTNLQKIQEVRNLKTVFTWSSLITQLLKTENPFLIHQFLPELDTVKWWAKKNDFYRNVQKKYSNFCPSYIALNVDKYICTDKKNKALHKFTKNKNNNNNQQVWILKTVFTWSSCTIENWKPFVDRATFKHVCRDLQKEVSQNSENDFTQVAESCMTVSLSSVRYRLLFQEARQKCSTFSNCSQLSSANRKNNTYERTTKTFPTYPRFHA